MNALAARRELLVTEAALHRQILALEASQLRERATAARALLTHGRWWLQGGAALMGVVLGGRWRSLSAWLPLVLTAVQGLKRTRQVKEEG
jgi:hypothetical protein